MIPLVQYSETQFIIDDWIERCDVSVVTGGEAHRRIIHEELEADSPIKRTRFLIDARKALEELYEAEPETRELQVETWYFKHDGCAYRSHWWEKQLGLPAQDWADIL